MQRKWIMNIGTWNTQVLVNKLQEVIKELQDLNMDIPSLSETKKKGPGIEEIGPYVHIWSEVPIDQRGSKGISIVIKNHTKTWEAIDERLIKVNLESFSYKMILGVYAPNENEDTTILDEFYSNIDRVISECGVNRENILLGDSNARGGNLAAQELLVNVKKRWKIRMEED